MDDGLDAVFLDDLGDEVLIAGLADDQRYAAGDRPIEAGGQVVEHDRAIARRDQRVDHMTSNVARAAGDQDRHDCSQSRLSPIPKRISMKNRL